MDWASGEWVFLWDDGLSQQCTEPVAHAGLVETCCTLDYSAKDSWKLIVKPGAHTRVKERVQGMAMSGGAEKCLVDEGMVLGLVAGLRLGFATTISISSRPSILLICLRFLLFRHIGGQV